ncbi:beta-galactosidase [Pullulanibacillus sp. KACC 23026]|uniref:beta-galactosidase n=1 Tax=Pullulanibacillus sp. KACC 23026 TaxID=3028315 RepID=UPI0023B01EE1|nr:beta-galactosidase [Pullulanibacillus sp. KACC 23026]WEG11737.1 beta-galactosidase [Pullulanibacillus sp. KACC 23026]
MFKNQVSKVLYGGDYNPEQWPRDIWDEDMRLFELAGIDIATLNVFSWALNQPDESTYNFEWLDEMMDLLHKNDIKVCLGTGTAAHPAWMAKKYPDVLTVDFEGRKKRYGRRHNSCPNSPTYRQFASKMARKLAERYKDHPALLLWHVNNEYGVQCYCDNCQEAFQDWLREKYGTLENVNQAWNTRFWGHTFYDWDQIVLPNLLSEHLSATNPNMTAFQGISLDYYRFNSDSLLDCYKLERDAIKTVIPEAIVTTNFQSNGTYKPLDYFKWAKELDIIALDLYPTNDMPMSHTAMRLDLMRGLKDGKSFMLMESCPSQLNWKAQNPLKRPGITKLWSYQALSRGADTIMYFQLRRSIGAFEKFHGALIDHAGHEHTRVFRECAELGHELQVLGDQFLGAQVESKTAILFDWDNWWAMEFSSGPTVDLNYLNEVQKYYDAFYHQNIPVDFVSVESDFSQYDVIIAPVLYMVKEGLDSKLEAYVNEGGTFVTTFFSGIVNENDLVTTGGYPGKLRKLLGIWVEEMDALFPDQLNRMKMKTERGSFKSAYECELLCDLIHSEGADIHAVYGEEFYADMPVLTSNQFGKGKAWYVGSSPDSNFLKDFAKHLCEHHHIHPILNTPENVEVSRRVKGDKAFLFLLNHNDQSVTVELKKAPYYEALNGVEVSGTVELDSKQAVILTSSI